MSSNGANQLTSFGPFTERGPWYVFTSLYSDLNGTPRFFACAQVF